MSHNERAATLVGAFSSGVLAMGDGRGATLAARCGVVVVVMALSACSLVTRASTAGSSVSGTQVTPSSAASGEQSSASEPPNSSADPSTGGSASSTSAPGGPTSSASSSAGSGSAPWITQPDGWSAVTVGDVDGPVDLRMLHLDGRSTTVNRQPAGTIAADLSPDARTVLLARPAGDDAMTVTVVDTTTGRTLHSFTGPVMQLSFTHPQGRALVMRTRPDAPWTRVSLDGETQVAFTGASAEHQFVQTADGTLGVGVSGDHRLTVHDNATGKVVRTVRWPAGATECEPQRPLEDNSVTVGCVDGVVSQVYRLDPRSGALASLTQNLPDHDSGYGQVWQTDRGLVAAQATSCGSGLAGFFGADAGVPAGQWRPIPGVGGENVIVGFFRGGQTVLIATAGCGGDGPLQLIVRASDGSGSPTTLVSDQTSVQPWEKLG
ncbi:hypothetical protein ACSDQ9_06995 [Aestuariimicrobium soli]|uniref:hypothetical protein n=1 Tax=Aestuariimicrobium soli TaxID=2035834 RepID=UPI003EBFABB4